MESLDFDINGTDTGNNNLDDFLNKICQRQIETTETRVRSSARHSSGAVLGMVEEQC